MRTITGNSMQLSEYSTTGKHWFWKMFKGMKPTDYSLLDIRIEVLALIKQQQ